MTPQIQGDPPRGQDEVRTLTSMILSQNIIAIKALVGISAPKLGLGMGSATSPEAGS